VICKAEVQVLRADLKGKLVTRLVGLCLALGIAISITSCDRSVQAKSASPAITSGAALMTTDGALSEVNIPATIARLAPSLDQFQPQVQILSPKPDQTITDDRVTVKLAVSGLKLFKQPELGLGNHLHVILDKQTYQGVYDLSKPLVFENLAAGTHSLRVFASRPWHESFKNDGAYAQISFNVLTKTAENNPDPNQPLLTYSRPTGTYGAEPIMLDYYLTNAPTQSVANGGKASSTDWRIRVTINEQQFILDGAAALKEHRWAPVYLQGFKPGKNWVRLELINDRGQPIPNVYNDTVGVINYDPQAQDALARLVRGEIDPNLAQTLVDPSYVAIKPAPIPAPSVVQNPLNRSTPAIPVPTIPSPVVIAPVPIPIPVSIPIPSPIVAAPIPAPVIVPSPIVAAPTSAPTLIVQPSPSPVVIAPPIVTAVPIPIVPVPAPAIVPDPTPIAPSPPSPIIEALPIPTPEPVRSIAPPITPIPIPAPVMPVAKAAPRVPPVPEVVQIPVVPTPQPSFVPTPAPAQTIAPVPPAIPSVAKPQDIVVKQPVAVPPITPPAAQPPQLIQPIQAAAPIPSGAAPQPTPAPSPVPVTTSVAPPNITTTSEKTWQMYADEFRQAAGVKIRAFTNTIPAKSQRFGHNVQIWAGQAINQIQAWRAAHVD
jgi:hypothetical protein